MSKNYKIALFIGSLRKDAYSRKLANILEKNAPAQLKFSEIKIADLPFYNEDLESSAPPAPWQSLRRQVLSADGLVFVTPEYNRSLPAALKNAIDVGSRPYGKNIWSGKPALVVSMSQGPLAGYSANQQLRQSLAVLDSPVMIQPETYIGKVQDLVAASDKAENQQFVKTIMNTYAIWLEKQLG